MRLSSKATLNRTKTIRSLILIIGLQFEIEHDYKIHCRFPLLGHDIRNYASKPDRSVGRPHGPGAGVRCAQ